MRNEYVDPRVAVEEKVKYSVNQKDKKWFGHVNCMSREEQMTNIVYKSW